MWTARFSSATGSRSTCSCGSREEGRARLHAGRDAGRARPPHPGIALGARPRPPTPPDRPPAGCPAGGDPFPGGDARGAARRSPAARVPGPASGRSAEDGPLHPDRAGGVSARALPRPGERPLSGGGAAAGALGRDAAVEATGAMRGSRGFSLVEVLVALVLFMVAAAFVAQLLMETSQQLTDAAAEQVEAPMPLVRARLRADIQAAHEADCVLRLDGTPEEARLIGHPAGTVI